MKHKALFSLALAFVLAGAYGAVNMDAPHYATTANVHAEDGVNVHAYVNGEHVTSSHNVLMEGEEAIEQQIRNGGAYTWDTIAVGNGTAPADGSGTLDAEIATCGLSPTTGTFTDGGDGSWNLSVTYNVTCNDIDVNTTAQKSVDAGIPSNIDYFAGTYLGRTINLYTGDSFTLTWENTVN